MTRIELGLLLLSDLCIVLAFPPVSLSPLIWIALIPFFVVLEKRAKAHAPLKHFVFAGLILSLGMTLGGFYWVGYAIHQFGELPWIVSFIGLGLFGLVCQPQFPIFALFYGWLSKQKKWTHTSSLLRWSVLAVGYTAIDWMLPKLFADSLGHSLYLDTSIRQIAEWGGVSLLTFFALSLNVLLWMFYEARKQSPLKQLKTPLILIVFFFSSALIWGHLRYQEMTRFSAETEKSIQIAAIQANIGDFDKVAAENGVRAAAHKVLNQFFRLSEEALNQTPKPQALVWPETAYPSTFRTPQNSDDLARDTSIEHFVREKNVPLLFGGYDRKKHKEYNTFYFLSPEPSSGFPSEGKLQTYHKNILLPFGEEIPFYDSFDFLRKQFPQVGNFGRGNGPEVFTVGTVKTGPLICYEALYSQFVIDAANRGSQLILNITNDSWFGPWGEPQLHLALSTFRSIETRLPFLRSTNTGITALILPSGDIAQHTAIGTEEIFNVRVPFSEKAPPTLLKAWGANAFGWLCLVLAIGLTGFSLKRKKA